MHKQNQEFPRGVWPVMVTPFTAQGAIDWEGLDSLIDWYVESGVSGLFTVCLSSEMYYLTGEEKLALAQHIVKSSAGRIPVIASGTFGGSIEDQAEWIKRTSDTGVDAVVVIACHLADRDQTDDIWRTNLQKLLDRTGDIPLGLYECPLPYLRLLSPAIMRWAAATGRFLYFKDTCCRLDIIEEKVEAARGTPLRLFNAQTSTLLDSLRKGADGYSGTAANFFPALFAWLCRHFETKPDTASKLQRFMTIADMMVRHKYPASAKKFLALQGVRIETYSRVRQESFSDDDVRTLSALKEAVDENRNKLN